MYMHMHRCVAACRAPGGDLLCILHSSICVQLCTYWCNRFHCMMKFSCLRFCIKSRQHWTCKNTNNQS